MRDLDREVVGADHGFAPPWKPRRPLMAADLETANVTAREAEVLELLADRLSNREIAEQLYVSVRTVETHVSSLLTKLGARDRRELATRGQAARRVAGATPSHLPVQLTSFVGREDEQSELERLLDQERMITVVGPAGAGKTRLTVEAARRRADRHRDGARFVDLAPLRPEQIADEALAALGGAQTPNVEPLDALVRFAAPMDALLVVDNCEHVLTEAATVIRALLEAAPRLRVVATSREPLGVPGEVVDRLGPLSLDPQPAVPDAVQLFVDRARGARADFALTEENAADILEVCRRLDGLPLALELAASHVATFQPRQLLEQLDERFRLLRAPRGGGATHQATLEAAIDWSYARLDDAERELFLRLTVLPASFSLDTAQSVCAAAAESGGDDALPVDVLGVLPRLVDQSLVVPDTAGRENRYRMLESIREFGRARLDRELLQVLERRLVAHVVTMSEAAEPRLRTREQDDVRVRLRRDHENIRRALDLAIVQGDPEAGLRILAATSLYWMDTDRRRELIEWFDRYASSDRFPLAHPVPDSVLIRAGLCRAEVLQPADLHEARRLATDAFELATRNGDEDEIAHALVMLGLTRGRHPEGRDADHAAMLEVAEHFRRAGDPWHAAHALSAACFVPDIDTILSHLAAARALYEQAEDRFRLVATEVTIALVLVLHHRDPERARRHADAALEGAIDIGSAHEAAHARLALAQLDLRAGMDTLPVIEDLLVTFRRFADHRCAARLLAQLGAAAVQTEGATGAALQMLREALRLSSAVVDPVSAADAFDALAVVATPADALTAVQLHASAAAQRAWEQIPKNESNLDWSDHVERLRAELGERFDTAWATGSALGIERAIEVALGVS